MDEAAEYRLNTGREPVERYPADHPDRWMWDYTGKPAERDALLERLASDPPNLPDEQEALF